MKRAERTSTRTEQQSYIVRKGDTLSQIVWKQYHDLSYEKFGTGGAEKLAEKYHTQLLGQMPLHISLREDLDKGTPTVISRPESEFTAIYRQLADRVAAQLYWQGEVIPGEISFRAV